MDFGGHFTSALFVRFILSFFTGFAATFGELLRFTRERTVRAIEKLMNFVWFVGKTGDVMSELTVGSVVFGTVTTNDVPDVTKYKFDVSKYPQLKIGTPAPTHTREELVEIISPHLTNVQDAYDADLADVLAGLVIDSLIAARVVTVRGE